MTKTYSPILYLLPVIIMLLSSCSPNTLTFKNNSDATNFASSSSVLSVTSANPSTGNTVIDFTGAIAVNNGAGITRVRLNKIVEDFEYDLYVYFDQNTSIITHISLSWTKDRLNYNNAFSASPIGAHVDLMAKKISLTNTFLNSGLPSSAILNGQFNYTGPQ